MEKKGVTIVEVITSAVILSLVFSGFLASFVAVKRYVLHANTRLVSMNLARRECDDLYRAVRADTWDTGDLRVATSIPPDPFEKGSTHNVSYDVSNVTGRDYRRVDMTVEYLSQ